MAAKLIVTVIVIPFTVASLIVRFIRATCLLVHGCLGGKPPAVAY